MPYAAAGEGRGRSAINLRAVDSDWLYRVRSAAYREKMTLRDFCIRCIDQDRRRVEETPVEDVAAPAPRTVVRNPKWFTAADKLAAALPAIAAQARVPMHLQTAGELARTIEAGDYAQPDYDELPASRK